MTTYSIQIYWPTAKASQVPIILGFQESSCVVVIVPMVEFAVKSAAIEAHEALLCTCIRLQAAGKHTSSEE